MFEFNLGYRYSSGEIEGFTGVGFTRESARDNAVSKAISKVGMIREIEPAFSVDRIVREAAEVTVEERESLARDWSVSRRGEL